METINNSGKCPIDGRENRPVFIIFNNKSINKKTNMTKSVEELCIQKIESGIRAITYGTKTPQEAKCGSMFLRLKPLNEGMYDDLMIKYTKAVSQHKEKHS